MKNGNTETASDRLTGPIVTFAKTIDVMMTNSSSPTKILKNKRAASVAGRASSSSAFTGASSQLGFPKCVKRAQPVILNPAIQVKKKTIRASGTVVFKSAVGEPPNGRPSALNGSMPN